MPTTTNFGWTTPADTDLVKDGAAAIRTLGNGVDTSFLDLKGGTSGQILAKNSNTDLDFVWVAQDDSNAIQNAIVDAKGDLISATAADTPARLAVGANGTVLTADSAESTGLKWVAASSGSMTLLSTTALSGTSTVVSSISQSYENLYIEVYNIDLLNTTGQVFFRPNSLTTGWYGTAVQLNGSNSTTNTIAQNNSQIASGLRISRANDGGNSNFWAITIFNYASTTENKAAFMDFVYRGADDSNNSILTAGQAAGGYQTNTNFDSFQVASGGGSFAAGSIKIYGVK